MPDLISRLLPQAQVDGVVRNLIPKIIKGLQEIRGEGVCLRFDLSVFRIPFVHVSTTAAESARRKLTIKQVFSEFVGQREVDAAFGQDTFVVDDIPFTALPLG